MTARTITTAAELDALPFPSVVAFPGYGDWHKRRDGRWLCDDGDVLTSGALALVANGELIVTGDPSAPAPVVSDAAVEAAAHWMFADDYPCVEGCACDMTRPEARAILDAALPFLGAAPSATRDDIEGAIYDVDAASGEAVLEPSEIAWLADGLLARFTITPRTDR